MKKLRVTWIAKWSQGEEETISADVPEKASVVPVGDDTLGFITRPGPVNGEGGGIHLAIPASRLVSAVLVEVEE